MATLLIDDHLLRGVFADQPARRVQTARRRGELATTELYYHRLCASFARPEVAGRLSAPLSGLDANTQDEFRRQLVTLPDDITTVPIRQLAWRMATLKNRFRISTLVAEALASAELLRAAIVVDASDVGPRMQAAAAELELRLDLLAD